MLPERRAVVFDMDDTLYPYRRFLLSGFAAVAVHLERTRRLDRRRTLKALVRASRGPERGRELQACMAEFGVPAWLLPSLLAVLRGHVPELSLPRGAVRTLTTLRAAGWRVGVLTNGPREIQARKVSSLGVARYVNSVVYASEYGGKPDPAPFVEVLKRLDVHPRAAVFVGDDERCDVAGAAGAGLATVRCVIWRRDAASSLANAVADRWASLPATAERLLLEVAHRHAA